MTQAFTKDQIKGVECRFAVFCPPPHGSNDDLHVVKELVHTTDGRTIPHVRLKRNYQRPYWITRKGHQNHKDKKEWEKKDHVIEYKTTQSQLVFNASRALNVYARGNDLRALCASPYLYGADILSTAVLKREYQDRWPELITPYTVSSFDIETDVVRGTEQVTMATLSFRDRVFTAVQKDFVQGYADVTPRLHELLQKYLGNFVEERGIKWEVQIVDSEIDVILETFKRAHEWKPDFVAIWNINFDMPKMLQALERAGIEPKDVFSDPKVPPEYRHFKYKVGPNKKVTASGKVTPIKPSAQWHTVFCPSSFYFIDAMCAYRHIRTGSAEEPSYALDAILDKVFKDRPEIRKLKFKEADGLSGIDWHQFMQSKYPLEYVIYNVFDCVSMEMLDEKTTDLRLTLPMMSGCSDFENFKSQPRRTADNLHYFALQNNYVFGTTSSEMASDLDKHTLGLDGWIVTLPAHLVVDNGLYAIEEAPYLRTNIRGHVGDLDVSASYPNGGSVFNISKETTHKELCKIRGVDEYTQRMQGINLSGGHTNAVEFACGMYSLPTMEQMLQAFQGNRTIEAEPAVKQIEFGQL